MKSSILATALLLAASSLAHANPFIVADDYPPGPAQARFCAVLANGLSVTCRMQPSIIAGNLRPLADLVTLPPGTYSVVLTVSTVGVPQCTSPSAGVFVCDGDGASASAAPITVTIKPATGTPATPSGMAARLF